MTADALIGLGLRQPPQNLEAEQALLGALLADNRRFDALPDGFAAEHFADPVHARIYATLARLIAAGQRADALTLKGALDHEGALDEVGGTRYLAELVSSSIGAAAAPDYARAVLHCALRRSLIALGSEIVARAFGDQGEMEAPAQIEAAEEALRALAQTGAAEPPVVPAGVALGTALAACERAAQAGGQVVGVPTGYAAIDRLTTGLHPGGYYLIGARPSIGKTSLGLGIAARAAARGHRVLFVSLEMTAAQLGVRLASAGAEVPTDSVLRGRHADATDGAAAHYHEISAAEWQRLAAAERAANLLPLVIDDRPGLSVAAIRARARRLLRRGGLALVVIDYAQLVGAADADRRHALYQQRTMVSAEIKQLAKDLGVPVLVLAQLNRQSESAEGHRPQISELRDSGGFEQDADVIMLLHRPEWHLRRMTLRRRANETADEFDARALAHQDEIERWAGRAVVHVDKNRQGPTGPVRLLYHAATTWFRDESEPEGSHAWARNPENPENPA